MVAASVAVLTARRRTTARTLEDAMADDKVLRLGELIVCYRGLQVSIAALMLLLVF
jgi:hypothetical protein